MNYMHAKNDKNKIIREILLSFIPLVFYGIYKNGLLVYQKHLINFYQIFKPLYLILITFSIYEIFYVIKRKKLGWNYDLVNYLIFSLIVMPNTNILIFSVLLIGFNFLFNFLFKNLSFNRIALMNLCLILIAYLMNTLTYASLVESTFNYSYSYIDYLFGHQIGGIASTNIILSLIVFLFLHYRQNIKSKISFSALLTYFFLSLVFMLINKEFIFLNIFNANVIFAFLFVASENISSPNSCRGMISYGAITGVLTFLFSLFLNLNIGVYLAILIASIILIIAKKIVKK